MIIKKGIDILIVMGKTGEMIYNQLKDKGVEFKVYYFKTFDGLYKLLKEILDKNTILLAKCHMHDYTFRELIRDLIQKKL